jgi:hypothetical protein
MLTHQLGDKINVREKSRIALTEYLTMFLPGSYQEALDKFKILLQANGDLDWEALKGHALRFFDEKRLSEDRVESLARIDRLCDALREIYEALSPTEWHRTVDDIVLAARFRTAKAAVQSRRIQIPEEKQKKLEPEMEKNSD